MNLSTALRIRPSDVVAFVGGGGKTSAMFRLAAEIVAGGGCVVTTTTTRIFEAQIALAPLHFAASEATPERLAEALGRAGHVLVTGPLDRTAGKALAVPLELISRFQALPGHPVVLIEADGSRMRPFKAPGEHEPVMPVETTLVVPVVGADVFGLPLGDEHVHRASRVAELAGSAMGAPITPALVARIVAHPSGGLKGVPDGARVIPLINKTELAATLLLAREAAVRLLQNRRLDAVVLGHVRCEPSVTEVWGRVAAVVLAAGQSTRMGRLKQILPWGAGGTIVGEVVRRLQASGVSEVVVVTGQSAEAVEACVADARQSQGPPVRCVFNPNFDGAEMGRSLQVGLEALPDNCLGALVALGDQPQVRPEVVGQLLRRWRETQAPVVAPFYQGQRGHPLLFDRVVWELVRALPHDANPRQVVQAAGAIERVDVDDDSVLRDMDTPEAYAREAAQAGTGIID
jgi:molybdenum cofactor cytidylyltransferase